jgi:FMN-dependent NADH-azoreductase
MIVRELIEELKKRNPESHVFMRVNTDVPIPKYEQKSFKVWDITANDRNKAGTVFLINQHYIHGEV